MESELNFQHSEVGQEVIKAQEHCRPWLTKLQVVVRQSKSWFANNKSWFANPSRGSPTQVVVHQTNWWFANLGAMVDGVQGRIALAKILIVVFHV